ncbi:MAG: helix-turn-helix domain-containing protein [Gemmatimonadales bacterium]
MTIIAAMLDSRTATATVRRAVPKAFGAVRGCRTAGALARLFETTLVDVAVVGIRAAVSLDLEALRRAFPVVPFVVFGPIRPDHGEAMRGLHERGVAAIAIEGVDDPVVGEVLIQHGYLHRRRRDLSDLPRLLRLTEPVQRQALDRLLGGVGRPIATAKLARLLGISREHLSRQFAAGGAPNLKRVIDLLQVLAARDLMACPGYPISRAASLLGFAGPSHLRAVVRRVLRMPIRDFRRAGSGELARRFVGQGTRSRT